MAVFVLVHGAYLGGWAWDRLIPLLEDDGHTAHAPDLIGAGRRVAELGGHVTAAGHADQLAGVLESEDLHDVVLVGHSYGGNVITMIPERSTRVAQLVYLDAAIPSHGRPPAADFPPALRADMTARAEESGDGWRLDPTEQFLHWGGISEPEDLAWMAPRLVPFPLRCFTEPVTLPTAAATRLPRTYIACTEWAGAAMMASQAERAHQEAWPVHQLSTGHYPMVTMADETALLLDAVTTIDLTHEPPTSRG